MTKTKINIILIASIILIVLIFMIYLFQKESLKTKEQQLAKIENELDIKQKYEIALDDITNTRITLINSRNVNYMSEKDYNELKNYMTTQASSFNDLYKSSLHSLTPYHWNNYQLVDYRLLSVSFSENYMIFNTLVSDNIPRKLWTEYDIYRKHYSAFLDAQLEAEKARSSMNQNKLDDYIDVMDSKTYLIN